MAGQYREAVEALRGLVANAERNGSLNPGLAEAFWNVVPGGRPQAAQAAQAAPAREQERNVNITLRVTGARVPQGATGHVEQALAGVARQQGINVVRGSVRVSGT